MRDVLGKGVASLLGVFNPAGASRYLRQRSAFLAAYRAARRDGPNRRWLPKDGPADMLNRADRTLVQARARDLARNDASVAGALKKICNNVVYTGIRPQVDVRHADGRDCDACARLERLWSRWAERFDLWEGQFLALRHLWVDGGFILHWYYDRALLAEGLPPLGFEMIPLERLDRGRYGLVGKNGNAVVDGIEYDGCRPVALHVMEEPFPGTLGVSLESRRLPLTCCRIVMVRDSIGQTVPMSWLASAIMTLHNLGEYLNSEQIRARLMAACGFFLTTTAEFSGSGNNYDGTPAPFSGGEDTDGKPLLPKFIDTGGIHQLPAGMDIKTAQYDSNANSFEAFAKGMNRKASAGMLMSYENFSNDFSTATYSSARSATLEERRGYRVQQHVLIRKFLGVLWDEWADALYSFAPHLADRHAFVVEGGRASVPVRWQTPGWQWVDPVKDATAAKMKLEMGTISRSRLCAEDGLDYEEEIRREAADRKTAKDAGVVLGMETEAPAQPDDKEEDDAAEDKDS